MAVLASRAMPRKSAYAMSHTSAPRGIPNVSMQTTNSPTKRNNAVTVTTGIGTEPSTLCAVTGAYAW